MTNPTTPFLKQPGDPRQSHLIGLGVMVKGRK